ncbi:MAG: DUF1573 domain-containing protein [Phycisphaerae bacterium]|jgi:hypothetical protein
MFSKMKPVLFAVVLALVCSGYAADGVASIQVSNPVKDLGEVKPHEVFDFTYDFKNTGDAELVISHVQATCGCTVPELADKNYAPGESGSVKVRYTASQREGAVTKHLYIHSNDPKMPRYELQIKSNTVLKVEALPKEMELSLAENNCGFKPIVVTSKDDQPFRITSVTSIGDSIKFDYDSRELATSHTINATLTRELIEKNLTGLITINTSHPDCSVVSVSYRAQPLYSASPARIIMQDAKPGDKDSREVWVRSNYGKEVNISDGKSKNGTMTWSLLESKGDMAKLKIEVTVPQDGTSRYFSDELILTVNDSELPVKCSGWFKK